jgi:AcrR family transcriptional regulator
VGGDPLRGGGAPPPPNDEVILAAARKVLVADPAAPMSAVAEEAGVGMSALYRRYPSKEDLLRRLGRDGLETYIAIAEDCVADEGDPWEAFATFMRRQVEAGSHALGLKLAGTFTPDQTLYDLAEYGGELNVRLFDRTAAAGVIRPDVTVYDLGLILEQVAAIAFGATPERNLVLRLRCIELVLDGLRATPSRELPGPTVTDEEYEARWVPRT